MNDNQERNSAFDEEGTAEPITKKVAKFSAFIYLGLAITVVIVATVGIFSMSYDYEANLDSVSLPELNYGEEEDISIPQIVITPEDVGNSDEKTDLPVIIEPDDVPADVVPPQDTPEEEARTMYYRPVDGDICKNYSMDALVYSETMGDYRVHSGIDIAAKLGTPVLCLTDGVVESVEEDYFYGMTVAISHENNVVSYYMNLDPALAEGIAVGNPVTAGQTIGTVGNSARCESTEEPHLHFELRSNGKLVDPTAEIPKE